MILWLEAMTMEQIDWSGIALAITALGGAAAAIIMAIKTAKTVQKIDHAVNGKQPGDQTMVSQVADLHSDRPVPVEVNGGALLPLVRYLVEAEKTRHQDPPTDAALTDPHRATPG